MLKELLVSILFFTSHPNPASHFADFTTELENKKIECTVYAKDAAAKVFTERNKNFESLTDPADLFSLTDTCKYVIADVDSPFSEEILKFFSEKGTRCIAYYDSPETFVPGGYSERAKKVIQWADTILFANANLEHADLSFDISDKKKIGLGYSPSPGQVENILSIRNNQGRAAFLNLHGIEDTGQTIAIYFGGANRAYYEKAFPHFLKLLRENKNSLGEVTFFLQQHPRAKLEGDLDQKLMEEAYENLPEIILSKASFVEAVAAADHALYYQTSGNAVFYLSNVHTFQVGHEIYPDLLVRTGLCKSVITGEEFLETLHEKQGPLDKELVYRELGIREDWILRLIHSFEN